ncbi:MAG: Wzz/FepE/Etk N-terminal domain-containing protein [Candidatus Marinamargulisbacteria bacterium]
MDNRLETIDDEIDLMPFLRHIIKHIHYFIFGIFLASFLAVILFFVLPKSYKASTSFILPQTTMDSSSGLLSQFGFFSSTLSSAQSGTYIEFIMPVFNSNRIKTHVASKLLSQDIIPLDSNEVLLDHNEKVELIKTQLSLSKKSVTLIKEEGVYIISYENENQDLILPVLNAYLNSLIELNEELNIDSDRIQIIPLDAAIYPEHQYAPNLQKLFLILNIAFLIIIFLWLIIQKSSHSDLRENQ